MEQSIWSTRQTDTATKEITLVSRFAIHWFAYKCVCVCLFLGCLFRKNCFVLVCDFRIGRSFFSLFSLLRHLYSYNLIRPLWINKNTSITHTFSAAEPCERLILSCVCSYDQTKAPKTHSIWPQTKCFGNFKREKAYTRLCFNGICFCALFVSYFGKGDFYIFEHSII